MMKNVLRTGIFLSVFACANFAPALYAQPIHTTTQTAENDLKKLDLLWRSYQDNLLIMDKALTTIKREIDENQKNARIASYTRKLEDTKNALNRLVLIQPQANQLRQQMLEHATKYQNVYKLSAISKPTTSQINMYQRLDAQTSQLYNQMEIVAKSLLVK